jgi:hypothetical protein
MIHCPKSRFHNYLEFRTIYKVYKLSVSENKELFE